MKYFHYSSPEIGYNENISYPTDIFSYGLIIYFLFEKKDLINNENMRYLMSTKFRDKKKMKNGSKIIKNIYT